MKLLIAFAIVMAGALSVAAQQPIEPRSSLTELPWPPMPREHRRSRPVC